LDVVTDVERAPVGSRAEPIDCGFSAVGSRCGDRPPRRDFRWMIVVKLVAWRAGAAQLLRVARARRYIPARPITSPRCCPARAAML